jgi:hypothetical protein
MKTSDTLWVAALCVLFSATTTKSAYAGTTDSSDCNLSVMLDVVNACSDGDISATVSGGTGPYAYVWSNGASDLFLPHTPPGDYNIIVVDANGCTDTAFTTIVASDTLYIDAVTAMATCGLSNGAITAMPYGGTEPYSFVWSNGETMYVNSQLDGGIYTVTVTDANGCTTMQDFTMTNEIAMTPLLEVGMDTCEASVGYIDVMVAGGNAPFAYQWSDGATTQHRNGLSAGTYYLTVTDSAGCILAVPVDVEATAAPHVVANVINTNCDFNTGSIFLVATGGAEPYDIAWSNGANTVELTNLAAGDYTVTVTDQSGCAKMETIAVEQNGLVPHIAYSVATPTCEMTNGEIDLTLDGGTAPYNVSWSNGVADEDLSAIGAGTYTVTVTGDDGCSAMDTVVVVCESMITSAEAINNANEFAFYPNPVSQHATINVGESWNTADVKVYDAIGQTVINSRLAGNRNALVDMSALAPGVYTIELNNDSKQLHKQFVKK